MYERGRLKLVVVPVKVLPTELYEGVKYRSHTQPKVSLIPLSLPLTAGSLGSRIRIRPYVDLPASIHFLGIQGDVFF